MLVSSCKVYFIDIFGFSAFTTKHTDKRSKSQRGKTQGCFKVVEPETTNETFKVIALF